MANSIATAYVQIIPTTDGIKGQLTQLMNQEGGKAGESSGKSFAQKFGQKLGGGLGAVGKAAATGIGVAIGAAAAGVAAITKESVSAFADFEQLKGGVETLFGAGGRSLEQYAESVGLTVAAAREDYESLMSAQNEVLQNADQAYMTAGLSANDYMETVTSFSASLIASLGGDTKKAAAYADKAIIDMSDNANKMGSDMQSIQNAYQGFAKQNYTMLDNLKLGYGGTKSEMERLVEDAEKLDDSFKAQRDANGDLTLSYADIVDAIHIVQTEMDITGTTQKEAMTTIQGSLNATKAAWKNLLTAFGNGEDVKTAIDRLVTTAGTAVQNIIPVVKQALTGIAQFVKELGPIIVSELPGLIQELLPELLSAAVMLVASLVQALPDILEAVWSTIRSLFGTFMTWLHEQNPELAAVLDGLIDAGKKVVDFFANFRENMANIWETIKGKISDTVNGIKESISNGFEAAKEAISTRLDTVKQKVTSIFDAVRDKVQTVVDKLKSIMSFEWHLPHLKLPHLSISGSFSISPPSVPHFSIEWYRKAYENPFLFNRPTVLGAMGFGDGFGGELVYGHENLMRDIREASGAGDGDILQNIEKQLETIISKMEFVIQLDDSTLVGRLAPRTDSELNSIDVMRGRGLSIA